MKTFYEKLLKFEPFRKKIPDFFPPKNPDPPEQLSERRLNVKLMTTTLLLKMLMLFTM